MEMRKEGKAVYVIEGCGRQDLWGEEVMVIWFSGGYLIWCPGRLPQLEDFQIF